MNNTPHSHTIHRIVHTPPTYQARNVLQYASYSYWLLYPAYQHVDKMYDPLWLLREFFKDLEPWNLIYEARESLRALLDRAFYTFEETFIELKVSLE